MRIILFRHGPAGSRDTSRWPDDAARPLTGKGAQRTAHAARGLRRLAGRADLVLTSPLTRACASAVIAREELEVEAAPEPLDALAPGGSYHRVLARLAHAASNATVVLVGHEPDLGKLAAVLVFGAPATGLPIKKAGACVIDFIGAIEPGAGRMRALLAPRVLRRLVRQRSTV